MNQKTMNITTLKKRFIPKFCVFKKKNKKGNVFQLKKKTQKMASNPLSLPIRLPAPSGTNKRGKGDNRSLLEVQTTENLGSTK